MASPPAIPTTTSPPPPPSSAPKYAPPAGAPAPAAPVTTTPAPHPNPKVAELQLIFPTVEPSVIELVLESCAGSVDRSIEQLLSLTDENFKPDELEGARREEASQVDLDEEFARSLAFQDEQHQASRRQTQSQSHSRPQGRGDDVFSGLGGPGAGIGTRDLPLPYEPRVRRTRPPAQHDSEGNWVPPLTPEQRRERTYGDAEGSGPPLGAGPGMLMMEEKLGQIAEVGKQTFTSLLSRARQKYNEFEQTRAQNQGQPSGQYGGEGQGGGYMGNANGGRDSTSSWGTPTGQGWHAPGGGRQGQRAYGSQGSQGQGLWGGSTYDDTSRSESFSSQSTQDNTPNITPTPPTGLAKPAARASPARWQPSDTYDDPLPPQRTPSGRTIEVGGGRRSPSVGSPDKGLGKIDPAKLGILPKKRVDLLSTSPQNPQLRTAQSPGSTGTPGNINTANLINDNQDDQDDPNPGLPGASHDLVNKIPKTPPASERDRYRLEDSDDDLEYTKNPFDER